MMGQNPGPCRGSAGRPRLHVEGEEEGGRGEVWSGGGRERGRARVQWREERRM